MLGTAGLFTFGRRAAFAEETVAADAVASAPVTGESEDQPPADQTATGGPAPEVAPSAEAAPIAPTTYAVLAGDTLYSIARKHGVSVDAVLWANNLSDANVLKAGQKLVIPPSTGKLHTAKEGDTIEALAQSYGVSKTGIAAVNGLGEADALKPGQRLLIPVPLKPPTDPAFAPGTGPVLQAANAEEAVPIPQDAGKGSPTPPVISSMAPLLQTPGIMTATGAPSVTVTNRKVPKLAWPIPNNPPKSGVSQGFRPGHTGIDIFAPEGTPIKAAASGTVKLAEKNPDGFSGYGWIVIIDHGDGISTWYAHCGSFNVKTGDKVAAGDTLATVGMTGRTTGPHCHFELRVATSAVDPRLALP
jgi:murein DD-endopeptidase MepM/ murein hydrolase activator NlpD